MHARTERDPAGHAFRFRDLTRDGDTTLRFSAVLGLQVGQTMPFAFIALMLPIVFREQGLPLEMMFLFSLPSIPHWLRPLWAAWVDRTGSVAFGKRRSWFVPCTLIGTLAYLGLSLINPTLENLNLMIAVLFATNLVMTTQDVAIDGYMVENIADHERPVAGAALDIARNAGMFIAWAGLGLVYSKFGWTASAAGAAILLVLFSLPGMLRREPPPVALAGTPPAPSFRELITRPDNQIVLPTCFVVAVFAMLLPALYPTFLIDLGFGAGEVALIAGPATLFGTLIGASLASLLLRRIGYRAMFGVAAVAVVSAIPAIVWLGAQQNPTPLVVFLVTLQGLALPTTFDVTYQAARLKWASQAQPATDYTAQIVAMRAGASIATAVGGLLAARFGWGSYFIIAGICVSAVCVGLFLIYPHIEALVDARIARENGQRDPSVSV